MRRLLARTSGQSCRLAHSYGRHEAVAVVRRLCIVWQSRSMPLRISLPPLSASFVPTGVQRRWCSNKPKDGVTTAQSPSLPDAVGDASNDATELLWSAMADLVDGEPQREQSGDATPDSDGKVCRAEQSGTPSLESNITSDRGDNEDHPSHGLPAATAAAAPSSSPPLISFVWVTLHNAPRNWLHEDIIELIHQVAEHAGVAAPAPASGQDPGGTREMSLDDEEEKGGEGDDADMLSRVTSPFVHRLHVPFGRRTGLVYGTPKLLLTSPPLAEYLTKHLRFDLDDFRSRVYFTMTEAAEVPRAFQSPPPADEPGHAEGSHGTAQISYTPIEETVEQEQEEALRTLELDRYLFAPDLLLDIAKSHQRRLVTKNEKVLLPAFMDGEEDLEGVEAGDTETTMGTNLGDAQRRRVASDRRGRGRKSLWKPVRAGTQRHLGRGSLHNMPIPKPYVEGRRL